MRPNEYNDLLGKIKCSDEFRSRMREKLSAEPAETKDYEESVSGTEVITAKHNWSRIAAIAAAFVLLGGAVGGGVYHFSKVREDQIIEEAGDSVYDKIRAIKEYSDMNEYLWNFSAGPTMLVGKANDHKEELFKYLEEHDDKEKTEKINVSYRSVRFSFVYKDKEYNLEVYENGYGYCSESQKGSGNDLKEEKYYFGVHIFEYLFDMVMEKADSDVAEAMSKVSENELEGFIDTEFLESDDDSALFTDSLMKDSNFGDKEYTVTDKNRIADFIKSCEWIKIKESEFDNKNCYLMGIAVSESGCMKNYGESPYGNYKLKDELNAEKLRSVIESCIELKSENSGLLVEDISTMLSGISDDAAVMSWDGVNGIPQGKLNYNTVLRYYHVSDTEGFIKEMSDLEWVTCDMSEYEEKTIEDKEKNTTVGCFSIGNDLSVSRNGYLGYSRNYCKLKNISDIDKLTDIFEKHFIMNERSKLADKIERGIDNYQNLEANFTYKKNFESSPASNVSLEGHLTRDVKNEYMYMTGQGNFISKDVNIEIVLNGENKSAYKTAEMSTGATDLAYDYHYSSVMIPMPACHYTYLCKDIEKALTPMYNNNNQDDLDVRDINGNTEYHWISTDYSSANAEYTIVLTKGGQLLSYEKKEYSDIYESFSLTDYVFDSNNFNGVNVASIYEGIKSESRRMQEGSEDTLLYPELSNKFEAMDVTVYSGSAAKSVNPKDIYDLFPIIDKESTDDSSWLMHGSNFKKNSKHGERMMDGYITVVFNSDEHEFVMYIPESSNAEWGENAVMLEDHFGTADECFDSHYRYYTKDEISRLVSVVKTAINGEQ